MNFFKLSINYYENIPNKSLNLIKYHNNKVCIRCGQQLVENKCISCCEFGEITSQTILYKYPYSKHSITKIVKLNPIKLSDLQKKASDFLIQCDEQKRDVLLWAVCGSGKTEITFALILKHINLGNYVAFVIPRKDILVEIYERIKQMFVGINVTIMSSDFKNKRDAQMYILTPNQLLRFKDAFTLIICDEVDAYPFMDDPRFLYAVKAAKRCRAITVYLTSTPSKQLLEEDLAIFKIYKRWHGYLLPEPKLLFHSIFMFKHRFWRKKVLELIENERQLLLFVGTIKLGYELYHSLEAKYDVAFVHAKDSERLLKINSFRQRKIKVLITTIILERGVTFNNIDVIVVDADKKSYNTAALVQIAGRVNRKIDDQNGQVIFCYEAKSLAIEQSINQIKMMNKLADKNT